MALVDALKALLGDILILKIRAQGAHWNVEGEAFHALHALFGALYEDVESSFDPIAEAIRQHEEFAPYSVASILKNATLEDKPLASNSTKVLLKDLDAKNDGIMKTLKKVRKAAEAAGDEGLANYVQERMAAHLKWCWQLRASMK